MKDSTPWRVRVVGGAMVPALWYVPSGFSPGHMPDAGSRPRSRWSSGQPTYADRAV